MNEKIKYCGLSWQGPGKLNQALVSASEPNVSNTFSLVGKIQTQTKYSLHSVFIHVPTTYCSSKPASAKILQISHFEQKIPS